MDKRSARKIATIQARMGSNRLPGKILMDLAGKPSLERMVERVRRAKSLDEVVVATTTREQDDVVERWAKECGVALYRGSENDVLLRVLEAVRKYEGDIMVQLTGDCPLIDPAIIDRVMDFYVQNDFDYVSNTLRRTFPRGLDTLIFSREVLESVHLLTQDPADREHVSLYIYEHPERFTLGGIEAPSELIGPDIRLCVDTDEDYELVRSVYGALYPKDPAFSSYDVMRFLRSRPDLLKLNASVQQKDARA